MTDNVTVREPEVARHDSGDDGSTRQPVPTDGRAEPAAQTTPASQTTPAAQTTPAMAKPDQVTTADMAVGGGVAPAVSATQPDPGDGGATAPLFGGDQASTYRSRWQEIQTGFVDEPRAAVQEADALVAEVMRQLARTFADERRRLEGQLAEGEEASTEDLRIALRRYRSFFDRLLSV
jgi:hypothetical protein